ncbi:c-type heme family protein [Singulisphaera sp. PoT]|uniref:c-type heme family protein n=1 Tax=Singulisphaera sp. PoT TaxID=3411797 RepID=UPI003BF4C36B
MTHSKQRGIVLCLGGIAVSAFAMMVALVPGSSLQADEPAEKVEDAALTRAREHVKMLDELYKTAVVSVTNKYEGPPAIKVAKDVFTAMEKSGWHKAKLVDASGAPQNEANLPATDFEKRAEAAIRGGKPYYEEVEGAGPKRTLYAATIVPAVAKKCATCHGVKTGDLLGFIRYEVPVK